MIKTNYTDFFQDIFILKYKVSSWTGLLTTLYNKGLLKKVSKGDSNIAYVFKRLKTLGGELSVGVALADCYSIIF